MSNLSISQGQEHSEQLNPAGMPSKVTDCAEERQDQENAEEKEKSEGSSSDELDSSGSSEGKDRKESGDMPTTTEKGTNDQQELVLIQDAGFNVQICVPGLEPFDLPVSCSVLGGLDHCRCLWIFFQ